MATYTGGTQVRSGYYVERRSYTFVNIEKEGTALPGGPEARYVKVPVVAVMAAAPALGGLFVVALPFIGIGLTVHALVKKVGGVAAEGATEVIATAAVPVPVRVKHLTGQAPDEKAEATTAGAAPGATTPTEQRLEDLQKEIEEQRGVIH